MKTIEYERNWCDYFTKCPYHYEEQRDEPYVGDYYCSRCKYHKGMKETKPKEYEVCDYSRYFETINGVVNCSYGESENI